MNLTEQYPSRRVRHLLGFPRSLLYRTPADASDLRAALLRLFADERVYRKSTRAASAGQPNRRSGAFALPPPPDFLRDLSACSAVVVANGCIMRATMPIRRAASSTERPAEERNSTIPAASVSSAASRVRATSSAGSAPKGARRFRHFVIQLDAVSAAPVLGTAIASSAVHEGFAHPLGRSGEELAAAIEIRPRAVADQAQVGFVDQRRRFERLTGLLSGHLLGRQLA